MTTLQKHPEALPYLFLTELWERYGFYVVQGLLVLYLSIYFGMTDDASYTVLGAFTALAYMSPIVGGYVADKYLGFKNCILWGGVFLIIGYGILAMPFAQTLLYPGLATIVIGTGLFKPNVSSLLGSQYSKHDSRLDSGFTIFYIGINLGAFLAGITSGYIREYFGWWASFSVASAGLVIGMATFIYALKFVKDPHPHFSKHESKFLFFIYCLLAIAGISFLFTMHKLTQWLLPSLGVILLIYLAFLTAQQRDEARERMLLLNALIVSSVIYWTLYLQMFFSANLFIERLVNKNVFGLHLTNTVFYASESIFIILLGPIFAWLWHKLSVSNNNPSYISKFITGIFFAGLGMLMLAVSTYFPDATGLVRPYFIFAAYFLITVGELCLSPIGLSAVTILSPANLTGMMMGIWFVAIGFGGVFAGVIAKLASVPDKIDVSVDMLGIYRHAFLEFAYLAFFVTILLFFISLTIRKLGSRSE
jgi:POT family proton-dependent oligopeptide transporter